MKGEKGLLYSLLIILALSSAISAISLRKEYRKEEALFQRMEENRSIALSLFNDYVNVDEYRVQSLMFNQKISDALLREHYKEGRIFMLFLRNTKVSLMHLILQNHSKMKY